MYSPLRTWLNARLIRQLHTGLSRWKMAKCSADDWSSVLSAASRAAWSAAGTAFSRAEKRAECLADSSSAVCLEALRAVRPVARSADLTAASMAENWAECSAGRTTAGRLRARLT